MPVSNELREILVCPKCKGELVYTEKPEGFGCGQCRLFYAVEDDIPNFLIDEAKPWEGKNENAK